MTMNPETNIKTQQGSGGLASAGSLALPPDMDPYANAPPCPFPAPTRHITSHNSAREAIFSDALPAAVEKHESVPGFTFYNCYTTQTCAHLSPDSKSSSRVPDNGAPSSLSSLPDSISKDDDIAFYRQNYPAMRELDTPHGSVLRILDFKPGAIAPMHRTQTLDYAFVLEGTVEAILDSGETRMLERGSLLVQRGTMHAWREATGENWARMGFVLLGFGHKGLQVAQDHPDKLHATEAREAGDVPEWKQKYDARNEGQELKEWVPWTEGVPPMVMAGEVIQAAEKGKEIQQQAAGPGENGKVKL